jgi:hypothetical protein
MCAESLRPYVVELSNPDNEQRRRVNLLAPSREEAAAIVEAKENEYVNYQASDDLLAEAEDVARLVHKDTDVDGRFIRAGKVIRTTVPHRLNLADRRVHGHVKEGAVLLDRGIGNTDTGGVRAGLLAHYQEKPYRIDRVGDTRIVNAVTAALYGLIWQDQIEGSATVVWASDTIKCALLSGYTLDQDTHDFFNDVSGTELANGNGYTTGGATLGSKTSTYDTASDQVRLDAGDVSLTSSTVSATDSVVYKSTGTASTSALLGAVDFGATVTTSNGTFTIAWDTTGICVFDLT